MIPTICHVTKRGLSTDPLPSSTFHVVIEWPLVADQQSHAIHGEKAIQFKVPGEPGSSGAVERSRECRPNYNKFTVVKFQDNFFFKILAAEIENNQIRALYLIFIWYWCRPNYNKFTAVEF